MGLEINSGLWGYCPFGRPALQTAHAGAEAIPGQRSPKIAHHAATLGFNIQKILAAIVRGLSVLVHL